MEAQVEIHRAYQVCYSDGAPGRTGGVISLPKLLLGIDAHMYRTEGGLGLEVRPTWYRESAL